MRPGAVVRGGVAVVATVLALVLAAGQVGAPAGPEPAAAGTPAPRDEPGDAPYEFLSAPDLFNGDVADLRGTPTWRPGMPNSWNEHWAATIQNIFGQLAAQDADDYLVAGDLVEGQWQLDRGNHRVFGTGEAAVTRAGNAYYSRWKSYWREAGVDTDRVRVAVGDHEIGDNLPRAGTRQYAAFDRFKGVFARQFTAPGGRPRYRMHPSTGQHADTAYAVWLAPSVLLLSVDVFTRRRSGVRATVDDAQLAWVRRVLARTDPDDTVLVQGHTPVLGPVRTFASSHLRLDGGERSAFWQLLRRHDVDLYLAGEVHADTAVQRAPGEPVQVTHGGLAKYGTIRFLTGEVADDGTVTLVSHQIRKRSVQPTDPQGRRLWSTNKRMPWKVVLDPFSTETGGLTLSPDGVVSDDIGVLRLNPDVG